MARHETAAVEAISVDRSCAFTARKRPNRIRGVVWANAGVGVAAKALVGSCLCVVVTVAQRDDEVRSKLGINKIHSAARGNLYNWQSQVFSASLLQKNGEPRFPPP